MAFTVGLLVLGAGAAQAAESPPGAVLDPTFGNGGVVRMPSESAFLTYGTATQAGDVLVGGGFGVQVLNDLGGTGEVFGGGSVNLPPTTGDEFLIGAITVDPQGRLLIAGTSFFPESENPSPRQENGARAFRPGAVRILRFLPDGSLDPTFGEGGVVETDLGLPPPIGKGRGRLGSHAAVEATGIAVDQRGRIVVTGAAVVRLGKACEHDTFAAVGVSAGFVARFTEAGAPDPSFGKDGLMGGRSMSENPLHAEAIAEPVVGPSGRITYRSIAAYRCEPSRSHLGVAQLTPQGQTMRAFGMRGSIVGRYRAIAGGPNGSVVALAEVPRRREKETFRARLIRIAPDGKRDGAFGKGGRTTVRLGPGFSTRLDSLAIDRRGRVVVGGTLGSPHGRSIVLLRLSVRGQWETNFGPHGRVATKVSRLSQFGRSDLFFDPQGRLVTVHQYAEALKGRSGLVVARYLISD